MQLRWISPLVLVLVPAFAAPALAAQRVRAAPASAARPATTGPALFYTIHVTISDSKITLSRQDLPPRTRRASTSRTSARSRTASRSARS